MLLILAVVAIRAVQGDGIISHAKNAQTGYEQEQAKELGILSSYEIELAKNSPVSLSDEMTSTKFAKTTFVKDSKGKIFVVPAGYTIVKDETTENTVEVDKGVVIKDDSNNQFVWVPVDNINSMARVTSGIDANGRTNYQGVLYSYTSTGASEMENYGQGTSSYREPDVVTERRTGSDVYEDGNDALEENLIRVLEGEYAKTKTAESFKNQLQVEYNSMVESVAKYGGFYVGRYEMSSNASGNAQSKSGETSLYNSSSENDWYGLYAKAKTYTNSAKSVVSRMIYGSQYDAMMTWMGAAANKPIGDNRNQTKITGTCETDKIKNVYDLYGNSYEWTQEANDTYGRVGRGGNYDNSFSPSDRNDNLPTSAFGYGVYGTRLTLYIK